MFKRNTNSGGKKGGAWRIFSWKSRAQQESPNNNVESDESPSNMIKGCHDTPIEDMAMSDNAADGNGCEAVPTSSQQPPAAPLFTPNVNSSAAALVTSHEAIVCAKRVRKEYEDLQEESRRSQLPNLYIAMDPENHLKWYVLIHSLADPCYENGEYLFHLDLSPRYPFAPPDFYFFTPNGRFEISRKLCFSNSSYHAEMWSPIWKIKTIILGFLSFFLDKSSKGVGHLQNVSDEKKRAYALESKKYNEDNHNDILRMIRHQNCLPC